MSALPLDQGITRFKANEDRFDVFANGDDTATFEASDASLVPSIRKFLKDKDDEINTATGGILEQTVAAKEEALAAAAYVNLNRQIITLEGLVEKSDPATITADDFIAALAANPDIREIRTRGGEYTFDKEISWSDRSLLINGGSAGATRINWTGVTSGFKPTYTNVNVDRFHHTAIGDINHHSKVAGAIGNLLTSNLLPYSLHKFYDFYNMIFTVENSASSFALPIKIHHGQGGLVSNIRVSNHRSGRTGVALEYSGFCLDNRLDGLNADYCDKASRIAPYEVQLVSVTGLTGAINAGEPVVFNSGGSPVATGIVVGNVSSSIFAVEIWTGTIGVGNACVGPLGSGTVDDVDLREWGAEGFNYRDITVVGCNWAIRAENTPLVAKLILSLRIHDLHANVIEGPLYLAYVKGLVGDALDLNCRSANKVLIDLVSCQRVKLDGRGGMTGVADGTGTVLRAYNGPNPYGYGVVPSGPIDVNMEVNPPNVGTLKNVSTDIGTVRDIRFGPITPPDTYTPGVSATVGALGSYTINTAQYRVRGKQVWLNVDITITDAGTASNLLVITLPSGVTLKTYTQIFGRLVTGSGKSISAFNAATAITLAINDNDAAGVIATGNRLSVAGWFEQV
ncbi:hypothetical protein HDIA_0768 [Hartmannibacter diazotrophicus]|uniref:Uncharacterized protein n=1 Tax=Hartmannibacter diazotrophicus TaxID=1482074 RepID=A0A2C9D2B4_9HYPH|nr:hypothetical protein [Hartmannibacter diazotrophicus]SON54309.1 hypothetical protein HDIA_0768 [Hartmannibacter diazotrophicus]